MESGSTNYRSHAVRKNPNFRMYTGFPRVYLSKLSHQIPWYLGMLAASDETVLG